jgi:putative SOS response-associated peptidase YedK
MCGRYVLELSGRLEELDFEEESAQLELELPWECYNIAPTQRAPVLDSDRVLRLSLWGLIPHWSKTPPKRPLINARAETAAEKPSFRVAYKRHRCAVPASGYFEWKGPKTDRKPFYVPAKSGKLLWLAGLSSQWAHGDSILSTFTILTCSSENTALEELHHRCPVALGNAQVSTWLQGEIGVEEAQGCDLFGTPFEVTKEVNKAGNDSPSNIAPL